MGRPKLRPEAAKAPLSRSAGILEHPEPIAQRFAHSTGVRQTALRPAAAAPARPATPIAAPARPASAWAKWPLPRPIFVTGLILAALVPGLILTVLWLGPRGATVPAPTAPSQETASPAPAAVLSAPDRIEATGGSAVSFPIALDGTDGVPARSVIAIKGLPQGSNFSEGRPYGDSEWTLRPDQIGDLNLALHDGAQGEFRLSIVLIAPDDRIIAEAATLLAVAPAPVATVAMEEEESAVGLPEGEEPAAATLAPDGSEATAANPNQQAAEPALTEPEADAEDGGAAIMMETASVPSRAAPPDQDDPADASTAGLGSVQPSVFVNMREEPSSSSPVLGVIAKGADLPVLDRKRGWVQVAHPETGKHGWIYSGLLVGEAKPNLRVRRIAPAETEAKSESFWGRVGRWLSPSPEQSNAN